MAKSKGTAGRAGTTEALTPAGRVEPGPFGGGAGLARPQSIYVGRMTPERMRQFTAMDQDYRVGDRVTVRWGYGSGFRAEGVGKIVKLYEKSLQVELERGVPAPGGGQGWPAGFVLKGIPRFTYSTLMNGSWNINQSVEPVNG